ncbi:hypothetical protein ABVK25_010454 [Lepraria finkii]|uniref:NACHT domain-containing protein n=1 Tax=Lepraria finkii TaxID=1340010 RepID=A0ABR4AX23_9LECA
MEDVIVFVHRYVNIFHTALDADAKSQVSFLFGGVQMTMDEKILDWLCPCDLHPKSRLGSFLSRRRGENAGLSLLEDEELEAWHSGPGRVLWLYGDRGVGKTILVSIVLEQLLAKHPSPNIGIAFLYFDYTSPDSTQLLQAAMSSLARQYVVKKAKLPPSVEQLFRSAQRNISQDPPDEAQLREVFAEMSKDFETMYIVMDALDELKGSETKMNRRQTFLSEL